MIDLHAAHQGFKERFPDYILLIRPRDEQGACVTFGLDARYLANAGGCAVYIHQDEPTKIIGSRVSAEALELALRALMRAGHKVAICDQLKTGDDVIDAYDVKGYAATRLMRPA